MSSLYYGYAPKMKPISPRRSALVAGLDIGSSKIVCLIARLRPHGSQQVLTRRCGLLGELRRDLDDLLILAELVLVDDRPVLD